MKSSILASALFASLALAAPLNKRAYATKTHTLVETVVVYTTVWDNDQPATSAPAAATSSPALFFEKPNAAPALPSSSSAPAPAPAPVPEVSSATPEPAPAPVSSSSAAPVVYAPPASTPSPEPAPVAPAAAPSSSAPAVQATPASSPSAGAGGGETYTGSLTMNYYKGGTGACGTPVNDNEMLAALAVPGFGDTTFNRMTGATSNWWCNKKIRITYNGKTADATIVDRCPGCTGTGGLDATPALWQALTGGIGGASGDRLETGMSFTVIG